MARQPWNPDELPDLHGRVYLVTGATAGLGYFSSEQLARAGAEVVMTGRNPLKLVAAKEAVLRRVPQARLQTLLLDTSNLGSIRAAAASARHLLSRLDGLLLNAGVVHPPKEREITRDGHERVLATNALGHFALAGELLPLLAQTSRDTGSDSRMVWIGSLATRLSKYDPVDPQLRENYTAWRAYVQSKVFTTSLGYEAARRLQEAEVPVASVVAHPGYSVSGRTPSIRGVNDPSRLSRFFHNLQTPLTQSKELGAWPLVRALVDPSVTGGELWAPRFRTKGAPVRERPAAFTSDAERGERLWQYCEKVTHVRWPLIAAAAG